MSNIRLDLSDAEAELLFLALTTVINASSPELMRQQGWEDVDDITVTTLVQSLFDRKDIETLSNIAGVMAPQVADFECDYSKYNITDEQLQWEDRSSENAVVFPTEPMSIIDSQKPLTSRQTNNIVNNIVRLDTFRKRKKAF